MQRSGPATDETFLIRMPEVPEGSARKAELVAGAGIRRSGRSPSCEYSTVGGALSTQIRNRAILAVALASVGILLYMAYAFRNTQTAAALRQLGAGGDAARRADRARRSFRFSACSSTSRSTRCSSPRC